MEKQTDYICVLALNYYLKLLVSKILHMQFMKQMLVSVIFSMGMCMSMYSQNRILHLMKRISKLRWKSTKK